MFKYNTPLSLPMSDKKGKNRQHRGTWEVFRTNLQKKKNQEKFNSVFRNVIHKKLKSIFFFLHTQRCV